ncbi:ribonuclease M5 [Companilactobacillus ginsenosidimutans]|uniref:Ribonuclease M5 n=1 Tax=Companilactobacillus ginsenosidimutans TaxID=1007676 RepID=A0A0H4QK79_9LACO|nr:ribonuclease M5 [Companilactobacillus ginsenosidimutans]AKP67088.1 DNA primase [Companilactobacillus ginsenosidimutans]
MTKKIQEIIVVEGKSDTSRLRDCLGDVDTIETNGSALSDATKERIKVAQNKRGVIIFTDPDFNGNRLRTIISKIVPNAKQAFLPRDKAVPKKSDGSLGIEHASDADIKKALDDVYTINEMDFHKYTQTDMLDLKLIGDGNSKVRREFVGGQLKIGYTNAKQFLNRLNMLQISPADLVEAIKNFEKGQTDDSK